MTYSSLTEAEVMKIRSNILRLLSEKSKKTASFVLQILLLILCKCEVDRIIYQPRYGRYSEQSGYNTVVILSVHLRVSVDPIVFVINQNIFWSTVFQGRLPLYSKVFFFSSSYSFPCSVISEQNIIKVACILKACLQYGIRMATCRKTKKDYRNSSQVVGQDFCQC